jgi:hypothetical protein
LRARRRRDREGEQSQRQKISQRVLSQFCNGDSRTHHFVLMPALGASAR